MKNLLLQVGLASCVCLLLPAAAITARAAGGGGFQREGVKDAEASQWDQRKQQLQRELRMAVQHCADALEDSSDIGLKVRFADLDTAAKSLLSSLGKSQRPGQQEERVRVLEKKLQSLESDARSSPGDPAANNIELRKQQLQARIATALTNATNPRRDAQSNGPPNAREKISLEAKALSSSIETAKTAEELDGLNSQVLAFEDKTSKIVSASPPANEGISLVTVVAVLALLCSITSLVALAVIFLKLRRQLAHLEAHHVKNSRTLGDLQQTIVKTNDLASGINGDLSRLRDDLTLQIASVRKSSQEARNKAESFNPQTQTVEHATRGSSVEPVSADPGFPALVSDYLIRIGDTRKTGVETDFRTNTLVQTSDGSGPFMLIAEGEVSDAGIVLPKPRLQRGQEFSFFYKGYYHCAEPSAGDVYIVEPAQVQRAGSGWRLLHMGRMEIR